MKRSYGLLSLLLMALAPEFAAAQSFSILPSAEVHSVFKPDSFITAEVEVRNTTSHAIKLRWKKVHDDLPAEWDYSLCDLGTCYIGVPDSSESSSRVDSGSYGFLKINLSAANVTGSGTLQLFLYEPGKFADGDTVTFTFNATNDPSGIFTSSPRAEKISIYPNPAVNNISLSGGPRAHFTGIYDMVGNVVRMPSDPHSKTMQVSSLPAGIYLVKYLDGNGMVGCQKLIKR